jgi:hypothetical protein
MSKNMVLTIVVILGLAACAGKPSVESENPANVVFRFQSENGDSVMTFWRKIESDGTKGKRFMVGVSQGRALMNMPFPKYSPESLRLDPGTYFLDSYQAVVSGKPGIAYCISQSGHYSSRVGWDDADKKPLYMAFSIKEGQDLTLPMTRFDSECKPTFVTDTSEVVLGDRFKK